MKIRVSLVAVVVAATVWVPIAAFATTESASKVTMKFTDNEPIGGVAIPIINPDNPDTFSGTLKATKPVCVGNRQIVVYKKGSNGKFASVTSAFTDNSGKWTVDDEDPGSGTYFAAVTRRKVQVGRRRTICLPAHTPTQSVTDS